MPENQPQIEERSAEPYVALRVSVPMHGLVGEIDRGFPELSRWLGSHGLTPVGAPFIRYLQVDMDADLQDRAGDSGQR